MKRLALLSVLAAAGCSAALPLPGTVADCDTEIAAVKSQIDGKKTELTLADNLLKSLGEEKTKLEGQPESDARTNREAEIAEALEETSTKKEALQGDIASLEERLVELGDHRKSLSEAEAEAKQAAAEEAKATAAVDAEAKKKADEEARVKAEAEAAARARSDEEAKKKADEEARMKAEAESKAKAEEEAKKKAEDEAKAKAAAEAEARKKAEEEARIKAEAAAQKQLEDETRRKAEAKVKGDECVVKGAALFREVADGMKNPPEDPEKVQALLKKNAEAVATLEKAKEYYGQMPAGTDPDLEARLKKIDQIIGLLRGYAEKLKK
jgi:chromosome segregation ATPase